MKCLRRSGLVLGLLVALIGCAAPPPVTSPTAVQAQAAATPATLTKVGAAWVAIAVTMMPMLMAQEGGYFEQQGLDVDVRYIAGSATGVASLVSGEIQVAEVAGSAVVSATPGGARLRMVAGFVNQPVFIALTLPSITEPSQLKGTTWAVTGIGTSDYFGLISMLEHFGLQASDVNIIAANNTVGQIAAVSNNAAQGILVSPPNDVLAQQSTSLRPFLIPQH